MIFPTLNYVAKAYEADTNGVPPQATFTRASTATRINALGQIATAASGVLRHDFDPVTGEYLGWLIEPAATNLITASDDFTGWSVANVTVAANATTSPDGTASADQLTSTGDGVVDWNQVLTSGTTYTYSFWVKRAGGSDVTLQVIAADYGGPGVVLRQAFTATSEWQRFTFIWTASTSATWYLRIGAEGTFSAGESIYVWGAQLEVGTFATSYIPTAGATATRNADLLTVAVSGLIPSTEYTMFANFVLSHLEPTSSVQNVLTVSDGSTNNFTSIRKRFGGNNIGVETNGTTNAWNVTLAAAAEGSEYKVAASFKASDFGAVVNGGAESVAVNGTMPTVTTINIGSGPVSTEQGNCHIRHIAIFPRRLSNADLQTITG